MNVMVENNNQWSAFDVDMSDNEFRLLRDLIYKVSGIHLSDKKKYMLMTRLRKRIIDLEILSFADYYKYLSTPEGHTLELYRMINAVSINKTEFFRENNHFQVLQDVVLPDLVQRERFKKESKIFFWSAGCSTGEEPYTIASVTDNYLKKSTFGDFSILATDIDTEVLKIGERGVYRDKDVHQLPADLRQKYMMHGKGPRKGFWRVVPELRNKVIFKRHNLIETGYGIPDVMDVIFCRNVLIYFDRITQESIFRKFHKLLSPGGYLFIGSSESMHGYDVRFKAIAPTVYQKYR